jgi:predicted PurR-regulated permease PerM
MVRDSIEKELKKELNRIHKKLHQARAQQLAAAIASGIIVGVVLYSARSHLPLLMAMAAGGAALNAIAARLISRKK